MICFQPFKIVKNHSRFSGTTKRKEKERKATGRVVFPVKQAKLYLHNGDSDERLKKEVGDGLSEYSLEIPRKIFLQGGKLDLPDLQLDKEHL